ncbi:MAG: RHS repeat protein, partial [Dokdonella sp.]|nr:RHS repeat protein [Dokdonella sp.]
MDTCVPPVVPSKNPNCPSGVGGPAGVGNPCAPGTGIKTQREAVYVHPTLGLELTYLSRKKETVLPNFPHPFGPNWTSNYDASVMKLSAGKVGVSRPNGEAFEFRPLSGGSYESDPDVADRLQDIPGGGWQYYVGATEQIELYDAGGRLTKRIEKSGRYVTLTYSTTTTPQTVAPAEGLVIAVTDDAGRSLQWIYDLSGRVAKLIDPLQNEITLAYGGVSAVVVDPSRTDRLLTSIQFPGVSGGTKVFYYNEQARTSSVDRPEFLTGIGDENGARFANFAYDVDGYATLTEHAGGASRYSITYDTPNAQATVTDPLGTDRVYTFVTKQGVVRTDGVSDLCSGCVPAQWTYDNNGNATARVDRGGDQSCYEYDTIRNLETKRVEGVVAGQVCDVTASILPVGARKIETAWDTTFRVPTQRTTKNASGTLEAKTTWTYNTRGQATARCELDPADAPAMSYTCSATSAPPAGAKVRRTVTTYCEPADVTAGTCPLVGLVRSVNGPRPASDTGMTTGQDDLTTYTYYLTDDATCASNGACPHRKGDLWKVTNALGQVTTYVTYDKNGRVTRTQDANGTYTDFAYHVRGWLTDRSVRANATPGVGDATTHIDYDAVGNVTKVTQPDGAFLAYTYDDAHRLIRIADNQNNTIDYCPGGVGSAQCLDAAGNRRVEQIKDPSGTIKRALSRSYNPLSQLVRLNNAAGAAVELSQGLSAPGVADGYDGNGNRVLQQDGLGITTQQRYDGLNRLVETIQNLAGVDTATANTTTGYVYDTRDNLRQV